VLPLLGGYFSIGGDTVPTPLRRRIGSKTSMTSIVPTYAFWIRVRVDGLFFLDRQIVSVSKHFRVLNISHHSKLDSIFVGKSVLLAEFAEDGIMVISLRVASCTGRLSLDR
jgi:hypothetical protein